jgi:hypothetical protein
LQLLPQNLLH